MTRYRIQTNGVKFKVQFRCAFMWCDVGGNGSGQVFYATKEMAKQVMTHLERSQRWYTVS